MPETTRDVSAFAVREVTGQKRQISLVGRALPHRPLPETTTQRVDITWYPGNPRATAQVLGGALEGTTIGGVWNDRFVSGHVGDRAPATVDGQPVEDARQLTDVFKDVCRQGQLLEVWWDGLAWFGFLTRFHCEWERHEDVVWEMTFEWTSTGDTAFFEVFAEQDAADYAAALDASVVDLASRATPPFNGARSFLDAVGERIDSVRAEAEAARDLVQEAVEGALAPADAARRAAAVAEAVVLEAQALQDEVGDAVPALVPSLPDPSLVPFGLALAAKAFLRGIGLRAREAKHAAARRRGDAAARAAPDALAVFVAREDVDLRRVAARYYGTQDAWRTIMTYNGLSSSRLRAGQVVVVPERGEGGGAAP